MAKAKQTTKKDRTADLSKYRLYTLTELEDIIGVTHRTLLSYVETKKLKAVKLGNKWKVSEENLQEFINGTNGSSDIPKQPKS